MRDHASMPTHAQRSVLAGVGPGRSLRIGAAAGVLAGAVAVLAALSGQADPSPPAGAAPRPVTAGSGGSTPVAPSVQQLARTAVARGHTASLARSPAAPPKIVLAPASFLAADGIPATALQAYQRAAARERGLDPACGLSWPLLAAIGRVESDHGRFAGAVLHTDGYSTPKVIGIQLNGHGTALIWDTDHGRLDGDRVYDRAVGPMQFIPSTWARYGVNPTGPGIGSPFDIFDAAAAAADYLCAAGGNLTAASGQIAAVLAYNQSVSYVAEVLSLEAVYAQGAGLIVPTLPPGALPTTARPLPAANPGPPLGLVAAAHTAGTGRPATAKAPGSSSAAPGTAGTSSAPGTAGTPSAGTSSSESTSSSSGTPSSGSTSPDAPPDTRTSTCPTPSPSPSVTTSPSGTLTATPSTVTPSTTAPTTGAPTSTDGTSTTTTATPEPCGSDAAAAADRAPPADSSAGSP